MGTQTHHLVLLKIYSGQQSPLSTTAILRQPVPWIWPKSQREPFPLRQTPMPIRHQLAPLPSMAPNLQSSSPPTDHHPVSRFNMAKPLSFLKSKQMMKMTMRTKPDLWWQRGPILLRSEGLLCDKRLLILPRFSDLLQPLTWRRCSARVRTGGTSSVLELLVPIGAVKIA